MQQFQKEPEHAVERFAAEVLDAGVAFLRVHAAAEIEEFRAAAAQRIEALRIGRAEECHQLLEALGGIVAAAVAAAMLLPLSTFWKRGFSPRNPR